MKTVISQSIRKSQWGVRAVLLSVFLLALGAGRTVSALTINLTYDPDPTFTAAGLTTADIANMKAAAVYAAAQLTSKFTDPINVNIKVTAVSGTGTLGESTTFLASATYADLRNAMVADATTGDDATVVGAGGSIPTTDPITGSHTYIVSRAQAKALGLAADDATTTDGTFKFGGGFDYTYDPNHRAVSGKYDFIGVAMHEFTEIMGRIGLMGQNVTGIAGDADYMAMDLFHYTGPGARGLDDGAGRSFSMDNGTTLLKAFNDAATNGGDLQDWASGTNDSFNAFSSSGVQDDLTTVDLRVMDAIGYDLTGHFYLVTSTADTGTTTTAGHAGTQADPFVSTALREAITSANSDPGSTIVFDPALNGQTIITATTITISANVTITGPGAALLTISGNDAVRPFITSGNPVIAFSGLTFSHAHAGEDGFSGGAIRNAGSGALTVSDCVFTSNVNIAGGGAIRSNGPMTVTNCTFANNSAVDPGTANSGIGGAILPAATLTLSNSTFSGNTAGAQGGAVNLQEADGTITNCTFYNNTANGDGNGGAIAETLNTTSPTVTVRNCTFSGDTGAKGASVFIGRFGGTNNGTAILGSNIFAENGAPFVTNTEGQVITSEGYNLCTTNMSAFLHENTDKNSTDPMFDPAGLANNGGPTETIALQLGSPAIDAGKDLSNSDRDQRGFARPVDLPPYPNAAGGDGSDIGAFEVMALPTLSINNVTVKEGDRGTKAATFTVSLSAASTAAVQVDYTTVNGTAKAGSDYQATSGTLVFAAGETSKPIKVTVKEDTSFERAEKFSVNLRNPVNATIADALGQATIRNDDAKPLVQFAEKNYSVNEGADHAAVTVTRRGSLKTEVSVHFATVDGTAHAGSDYRAQSGILKFGPNETSKTIKVPIINDRKRETSEFFKVRLTANKIVAVGKRSTAIVTIPGNDRTNSSTDEPAASESAANGPAIQSISAGMQPDGE